MSNFLDEIKKRLQVWHEHRAERIEAARQAQLDAEARERVQVMEYNGDLYVSMNGVPLLANIHPLSRCWRSVHRGCQGQRQGI